MFVLSGWHQLEAENIISTAESKIFIKCNSPWNDLTLTAPDGNAYVFHSCQNVRVWIHYECEANTRHNLKTQLVLLATDSVEIHQDDRSRKCIDSNKKLALSVFSDASQTTVSTIDAKVLELYTPRTPVVIVDANSKNMELTVSGPRDLYVTGSNLTDSTFTAVNIDTLTYVNSTSQRMIWNQMRVKKIKAINSSIIDDLKDCSKGKIDFLESDAFFCSDTKITMQC